MLENRLSKPLKVFFTLPYFILIITGFIIPSDGQHGILNIKSLAFLGTAGVLFLHLFLVQKINLFQWRIFGFLFGSLCFLLLWLSVSSLYGETPFYAAFDQLKVFLLTISVVTFSCYLVAENLITFQQILKTAIYANFGYSSCKVGLVLLHSLGLINIWPIVTSLGIRFMSMPILGGLARLQTSMDIATPFLLFFFLQGPQLGINWTRRMRIAYLLVSFIAIFLSFSRFLIAISLVSLFLHAFTRSLAACFRLLLAGLCLCAVGYVMIGSEKISKIVESRLYSKANRASDTTRTDQIEALLSEHGQFPLFGKGLGGYAPQLIRDTKLLHLYEVQWVALLMQVGWVGLAFCLFPVGMVIRQIFSPPYSRSQGALCLLFICWLLAGFTNPFLFSLTSGVLYSLFFLAGRAQNRDIKLLLDAQRDREK